MKPYQTAIKRKALSAPIRKLLQDCRLDLTRSILDYGCGRGDDARILSGHGATVEKYDPHYVPIKPHKMFDQVLCTYVLNVCTDDEIKVILDDLSGYCKQDGRIFISVRRDLKEVSDIQRYIELDLTPYVENSKYCIYIYDGAMTPHHKGLNNGT